MLKKILVGFVCFFSLMLVGNAAGNFSNITYVDSCQNINSAGIYYLNQTLDSISGCFDVSSDDVLFDCNGFSMVDSDNRLFDIYYVNNFTLQNCNISGTPGTFRLIDVQNLNNGIFKNITLDQFNYYGFDLMELNNVSFEDITSSNSETFFNLINSQNVFLNNFYVDSMNNFAFNFEGNFGNVIFNNTFVINSGYSVSRDSDLNGVSFFNSNFSGNNFGNSDDESLVVSNLNLVNNSVSQWNNLYLNTSYDLDLKLNNLGGVDLVNELITVRFTDHSGFLFDLVENINLSSFSSKSLLFENISFSNYGEVRAEVIYDERLNGGSYATIFTVISNYSPDLGVNFFGNFEGYNVDSNELVGEVYNLTFSVSNYGGVGINATVDLFYREGYCDWNEDDINSSGYVYFDSFNVSVSSNTYNEYSFTNFSVNGAGEYCFKLLSSTINDTDLSNNFDVFDNYFYGSEPDFNVEVEELSGGSILGMDYVVGEVYNLTVSYNSLSAKNHNATLVVDLLFNEEDYGYEFVCHSEGYDGTSFIYNKTITINSLSEVNGEFIANISMDKPGYLIAKAYFVYNGTKLEEEYEDYQYFEFVDKREGVDVSIYRANFEYVNYYEHRKYIDNYYSLSVDLVNIGDTGTNGSLDLYYKEGRCYDVINSFNFLKSVNFSISGFTESEVMINNVSISKPSEYCFKTVLNTDLENLNLHEHDYLFSETFKNQSVLDVYFWTDISGPYQQYYPINESFTLDTWIYNYGSVSDNLTFYVYRKDGYCYSKSPFQLINSSTHFSQSRQSSSFDVETIEYSEGIVCYKFEAYSGGQVTPIDVNYNMYSFKDLSKDFSLELYVDYGLDGYKVNNRYMINESYNLTGSLRNFGDTTGTFSLDFYYNPYCIDEYDTWHLSYGEEEISRFELQYLGNVSIDVETSGDSVDWTFEGIISNRTTYSCYNAKLNDSRLDSVLDYKKSVRFYDYEPDYYLDSDDSRIYQSINESKNLTMQVYNQGVVEDNYSVNLYLIDYEKILVLDQGDVYFSFDISSNGSLNDTLNISGSNVTLTIFNDSITDSISDLMFNVNVDGVSQNFSFKDRGSHYLNSFYIHMNAYGGYYDFESYTDVDFYFYPVEHNFSQESYNSSLVSCDKYSYDFNLPMFNTSSHYYYISDINFDNYDLTPIEEGEILVVPDLPIIELHGFYAFETKVNEEINFNIHLENYGSQNGSLNFSIYSVDLGLSKLSKIDRGYWKEIRNSAYSVLNGTNVLNVSDSLVPLNISFDDVGLTNVSLVYDNLTYEFSLNLTDSNYRSDELRLGDELFLEFYWRKDNESIVDLTFNELSLVGNYLVNVSANSVVEFEDFSVNFSTVGNRQLMVFPNSGNIRSYNKPYYVNSSLIDEPIRRTNFCVYNSTADLNRNYFYDDCESDIDGDGIEDVLELYIPGNIIGDGEIIETEVELVVEISSDSELNKTFTGDQKVAFVDNSTNKSLVEFNFNFSDDSLNLMNVSIDYDKTTSNNSFMIVKGLALEGNATKDVMFERSNSQGDVICVKDQEVSNIYDMTVDCTGVNEYKLTCDGVVDGNYTCSIVEGYFLVTGLKHSAILELGENSSTGEDVTPPADDGGNDDGGTRPSGGSDSPSNDDSSDDVVVVSNPVIKPESITLNSNYNILVNGVNNLDLNYSGVKKILLKDKVSNVNVVEFTFDFGDSELDLSAAKVLTGSGDKSYVIVKGIELDTKTKTVRLPIKQSSNKVCIKDAEVSSIDDVSSDCSGDDEFVLECGGLTVNTYSCDVVNGYYVVDGLKHSAVVEMESSEEIISEGSSVDSSEDSLDSNSDVVSDLDGTSIDSDGSLDISSESGETSDELDDTALLVDEMNENSGNLVMVVSIGLIVLLSFIGLLVFLSKRKPVSNREVSTSQVRDYTDDYYFKIKDYVKTNKGKYSKDQIRVALKNVGTPDDLIDRVFSEEFY